MCRFIQVSIIMSRDKAAEYKCARLRLAGLANECKRWEVAYHLYNPERIVLWLHFETMSHSVIGP